MITPVIRVYSKNVDLYVSALEASIALDGRLPATLLLAHDSDYDPFPVLKVASRAFTDVKVVPFDPVEPNQLWPLPQNTIWQQVARWVDDNHATAFKRFLGWLWWEADACPIRAGWLTTLTNAYKKGRCLFAGVPCQNNGEFYMNGVGIYPGPVVASLSECSALYCRTIPFDVAAGAGVYRSFCDLSSLIHHARKTSGGVTGVSFTRNRYEDLLQDYPDAVFYHGCDGSLATIVAGKEPVVTTTTHIFTGRNVFYHSGDLGDIVYSLPTVREIGGGDIYLGPDNRTRMMTREKMTERRAELIIPLLEAQPYVHRAFYGETLPTNTTHDLNTVRHHLRELSGNTAYNLARCHLHAFGLGLDNDRPAWLTVDSPRRVAPVVIARSSRYHNHAFDWRRLLTAYRGQCVFVGSPEEHLAFNLEFDCRIPYEATSDLLDLARVIAGSQLFIGNQSCPYAIAEGLKMPSILEQHTGCNTLFQRPDAIHELNSTTILPEVTVNRRRSRLPSRPIIIRGPVDIFSGFGQLVRTLSVGLKERGHDIKVASTLTPDTRFQADIPKLDDTYRSILIPPADKSHIIISMHCGLPTLIQGGEVVFTMWESTRVVPATVNYLNKASRVVLPSTWAATSFSACGVDTPISIVPLGVDTSIYKPQPHDISGNFIFGTAGRVAHGGCRKGIEDVISAFRLAFPTDPDVRLKIKCFKDCRINSPVDSRISLQREFMPDLASWYGSLDVFVTATRGEGWGLHLHQAMACGRSIIAPQYSAISDYFDDSVGWPVKFDLVPATEFYTGKGVWAKVDVDDMASQMLESRKSPMTLEDKGQCAAQRAARFSNDFMIENFESILKLEGIL